ncbi:MAG: small subunit ribosomal protein S17 [Lysobacterales bacterium]|jgi:small subunit ribosomal protein S17
MEKTAKRENKRKVFQATVVSAKMEKTCVVRLDWATTHDKYDKVVRRATKFKAHDEKNETKEGDVVRIQETRPLSKDKSWLVTEIIKKAN